MNKYKNKSFISFLIKVWLPILSCAVGSFILDRVLKEIVLIYFSIPKPPLDITSFFKLELIINYGISFSFLQSLNRSLIVLISLCALIILIVLFYKITNFSKLSIKLAIGIIIGATFGNIYDRVVFGGVIDFFHLYYKSYSFPIFNFADVLISISGILLFVNLMFDKQKSKITRT